MKRYHYHDNSSEFCPTLLLILRFYSSSISLSSPDMSLPSIFQVVPAPNMFLHPNPNPNRFHFHCHSCGGNGDEEGGIWHHPMVANDDPETVHFITHILGVVTYSASTLLPQSGPCWWQLRHLLWTTRIGNEYDNFKIG